MIILTGSDRVGLLHAILAAHPASDIEFQARGSTAPARWSAGCSCKRA
jgi:hypothetical protein